MSDFIIPYVSEDFPGNPSLNSGGRTKELSASWNELIKAALTVGRKNWTDVWQHGLNSAYEAIFRVSLVKMALVQRRNSQHLYISDAFNSLDPSEKAAISYFLGMTICKLFATKLLDTPWLLHFDVYQSELRPRLQTLQSSRRHVTRRSRPDLVGEKHGFPNLWSAFECKGHLRVHQKIKETAKAQASVLLSVTPATTEKRCDLHVGATTYVRQKILHFYWRDPEPESSDDDSEFVLTLPPIAWRYYYAPAMNLIQRVAPDGVGEGLVDRPEEPERTELLRTSEAEPDLRELAERLMASGERPVSVDELDFQIGVHRSVAEYLAGGDWDGARRRASEMAKEFAEKPGFWPDGLIVKAGPSWSRRRYGVDSA